MAQRVPVFIIRLVYPSTFPCPLSDYVVWFTCKHCAINPVHVKYQLSTTDTYYRPHIQIPDPKYRRPIIDHHHCLDTRDYSAIL